MFSMNNIVRYSEAGPNATITPSHIIDYFQDCTNMQTLSVDSNFDFADRYLFILSSWQIVFNTYPKIGDQITTSTWGHYLKGIQGHRNFTMKDSNGNLLAYANSIWTYMDMTNYRPAPILEREFERYPLEAPLEMEYAPRKISLRHISKDSFTFMGKCNVTLSMLDTNHHMNNCEYVRCALNFMPIDTIPKQIRVEYKSSAQLNDILYFTSYTEDSIDHTTWISIHQEDGTEYAILEIKY